jgi:hypothetical protein
LVLTRPRFLLALLVLLVPVRAQAQRDTTRDALERVEASLTVRTSDGAALSKRDLLPVIIVSTEARYEETRAWFPAQAAGMLVRVFGSQSVRLCEACMAPRLRVEGGRVEQTTVALDVQEIVRLDESARGHAEPARTAIWLDETARGVALRIVDLSNSRVLAAENFDDASTTPSLERNIALAKEAERRSRGEALVHTFFDLALIPSPHVSLDWAEQFGPTNANLAGVSLSLFDPVLGLGASYYRVIPEAFNLTIGAQVLVSVPTALQKAISGGNGGSLIDPLLTAVAVLRVPIAQSNFGLLLTASTNGRVGFGFSLLNVSLLPVLP